MLDVAKTSANLNAVTRRRLNIRAAHVLAALAILFLALFNLGRFPAPWFDEGSHLHVPKTLVRFGVYADYGSEGFRYYGPSIGIGPTVMLPVAAAFKVFGIGLLQARLVMVAYLLAAIAAFFGLARAIGGARLAWFAAAILIGSQGINLLEWGRQMVGEVPALALMAGGWLLWVRAEENPSLRGLLPAGTLMGLAAVTKSQTALILVPTLFVAWLANWLYYRRLPHRYFLVPLLLTGGAYAAWQFIALALLGPGTLGENLALLQKFSAGAAFVFSPNLIVQSARNLLGPDVFAGWMIPVLVYGVAVSLRRSADGQRWGSVMIFVLGGLAWYVFASISWLRYAFAPLAMAALVAARLLDDVLGRFDGHPRAWWARLQQGELRATVAPIALIGFVLMSLMPLALTARNIVSPPPPAAQEIANYLDANIPKDALIETWEPELGFLTDHNYHFPPHALLDTAVRHVWLGGPAPADQYDFKAESPDYVIQGAFSDYAGLYAPETLSPDYELVTRIGAYRIYARSKAGVRNLP
jgi:hypothetical protein